MESINVPEMKMAVELKKQPATPTPNPRILSGARDVVGRRAAEVLGSMRVWLEDQPSSLSPEEIRTLVRKRAERNDETPETTQKVIDAVELALGVSLEEPRA